MTKHVLAQVEKPFTIAEKLHGVRARSILSLDGKTDLDEMLEDDEEHSKKHGLVARCKRIKNKLSWYHVLFIFACKVGTF